MNWHFLCRVSKDCIGLSETWSILIATTPDALFAWTATGGEDDGLDHGDTGSASEVAEDILKNAGSQDGELVDALKLLVVVRIEFQPLLNAVLAKLKY